MSAPFHEIEAEVRYLTTEEGGRKTGVCSGYRGQFWYEGHDYDGFQYFPDLPAGAMVELGITVRAVIRFRQERWENVHSRKITVGMPFQIREGNRTVGRGIATKV
jgi:translation elongation factor EF-Tu-like GTPase